MITIRNITLQPGGVGAAGLDSLSRFDTCQMDRREEIRCVYTIWLTQIC